MWYTKFLKVAQNNSLTFVDAANQLKAKFPTYTSLGKMEEGPFDRAKTKLNLGLKDGQNVKYFDDTFDNLIKMTFNPSSPSTPVTQSPYTDQQIDQINAKIKQKYPAYNFNYVIDTRGLWSIIVGDDSLVGTPQALIAGQGEKIEHDAEAEPAAKAEYEEYVKTGGLKRDLETRIQELGGYENAKKEAKNLVDLYDMVVAGKYKKLGDTGTQTEIFIPKATSFDTPYGNAASGNLQAKPAQNSVNPAPPKLPVIKPGLIGVPISLNDPFQTENSISIDGFINQAKEFYSNLGPQKLATLETELRTNFAKYAYDTYALRDLVASIDLGHFKPTP